MMSLDNILILARKHLGGDMESSARVCLSDAIEQKNQGNYEAATRWALKSIAYSVGIFHSDYQRAVKNQPYSWAKLTTAA